MWERFGYICRKTVADYQQEKSVQNLISEIEKTEGCDQYGPALSEKQLPGDTLIKIKHIPDDGKAMQVMALYGDLKLSCLKSGEIKIAKRLGYLGYLSIIFFILVGLYSIYIAPAFLETFESMDISDTGMLKAYKESYAIFSLVVLLVLLVTLVLSIKLKALFKFKTGSENDFFIRAFTAPGIRRAYGSLIAILRFPVVQGGKDLPDDAKAIVSHLNNVKSSGMDLSKEMQVLLEREADILVGACERQLRWMSVFLSAAIISAIAFFLVSAYSPMFKMGDFV